MKPVFQEPMDGQCVRACVASVLGLRFDQVPSFQCEGHTYVPETKEFLCTIPEHLYEVDHGDGVKRKRARCDSQYDQDQRVNAFLEQFGLTMSHFYMSYGDREIGARGPHTLPPGICIANGKSPRGSFNHVVVWDTRLRDFEHPYGRMVHDPFPAPEGERPGIGPVETFYFIEVVDTDNLHRLTEMQREGA